MFVSVKYTRKTKPNDAMYVWLENVNSGGFEVCIREFLPFDGKHQDTVVVSELEVFGSLTVSGQRNVKYSIKIVSISSPLYYVIASPIENVKSRLVPTSLDDSF